MIAAGPAPSSPRIARALWTLYEPIHAVTYFAPEAQDAFTRAGLRGFWRGYFAGRSAPLGAVAAAPVVALYNSFAPSMVQRALPALWDTISPAQAIEARALGAANALRELVDDVDPALLSALEALVSKLETAGRALAAANAALPPRSDPHERLWQAVTTLREYRGDAHVAALVVHDLAGLEIVALRCLIDLDRARVQPARGWTDEQWDECTVRLAGRGLVDARGAVTSQAMRLIAEVEQVTDEASAAPTAEHVLPVASALLPIARACARMLPYPNPIGVPALWDPHADPTAAGVAVPRRNLIQ